MNVRENYGEDDSLLGLLSREQERRLRAQAWRYVRRINPVTARRIWLRVRARDKARQAA